VGLAPNDGVATFFVSEGNRGVWSSLDPAHASRENLAARAVTIPTRSLRGLLREFGVPFYLKMDIEGAEHLCLPDLDCTNAPAYVSFEASPGRLDDLFLLARAGYTRFKLIDQLAAFRQAVPPPLHSVELAQAILSRGMKQRLRRLPGLTSAVRFLRRAWRPARSNGRPAEEPAFPISTSGPMAEATDGPWRSVEEVAYAWLYYVRETTTSNWYDVHAAR
jgi:hypothetical protein